MIKFIINWAAGTLCAEPHPSYRNKGKDTPVTCTRAKGHWRSHRGTRTVYADANSNAWWNERWTFVWWRESRVYDFHFDGGF
jgi:hypothetical protein